MSIIDCRVKNLRKLGYNNLREWIDDPNNAYIGRASVVTIDGHRYPSYESPFYNPFKVGKDGDIDEVKRKYRKYMYQKLEESSRLLVRLGELKGKNLGSVDDCVHGLVLLELINNYY